METIDPILNDVLSAQSDAARDLPPDAIDQLVAKQYDVPVPISGWQASHATVAKAANVTRWGLAKAMAGDDILNKAAAEQRRELHKNYEEKSTVSSEWRALYQQLKCLLVGDEPELCEKAMRVFDWPAFCTVAHRAMARAQVAVAR